MGEVCVGEKQDKNLIKDSQGMNKTKTNQDDSKNKSEVQRRNKRWQDLIRKIGLWRRQQRNKSSWRKKRKGIKFSAVHSTNKFIRCFFY